MNWRLGSTTLPMRMEKMLVEREEIIFHTAS